MPPTNITVSLDMREAASALLGGSTPAAQQTGTNQAATAAANASAGALALEWPSFHNGVAAGLRLTGANGIDAERGARDKAVGRSGLSLARGGITRTWIVYNRPTTPTAAHGGLLMALGLHGHLSALAMTDIYEYLTLGHDPTTVGVLLGMAAARAGSADPAVSKMLCLHIPSLLPPPFVEMDVSAVAQTAAMAGVGLLYRGTAHRLMVEFLLAEISKRPSSDRCDDREALRARP